MIEFFWYVRILVLKIYPLGLQVWEIRPDGIFLGQEDSALSA